MRVITAISHILIASKLYTNAFVAVPNKSCRISSIMSSTMADSGVPPTSTSTVSEVPEADIPKTLPSDVGMDYVPLATMLATGELAKADQVNND